MRSPPQSSMGMAPAVRRWPMPQIDAIVDGGYGKLKLCRLLQFACLDSQDEDSVARAREAACEESGVRRSGSMMVPI